MRIFSFVLIACLFAAGLMSPAVVRAGEKSWAGRQIVLKKRGNKIGYTDDNGKQVILARLSYIHYIVLDDKDGWLKVRHEKQVGWFDKAEAILAEDAEAYFSGRVQAEPNNVQHYIRRGWSRNLLRQYEKAASDFSAAIRMEPREVDWWTGRAQIYANMLEYGASIRDYSRAIQISPNLAWLYASRGWVHGLNGDAKDAFADFDTALRLDPSDADVYNQRGRVRTRVGDYAGAVKDFDESVRLNADNVWPYNNRGVALNKHGDYARAIADLEKAVEMEPYYWEPRKELALVLATCPEAKFRNAKRALEMAERAAALSQYRDPGCLDALAAAHALAGQFEQAIKRQQQALQDLFFAQEHGDAMRQRLKNYEAKKAYTVAKENGKGQAPLPEAKEADKKPAPSFIAEGPLKNWREFKSAEGRFTVAFPETPRQQKQAIASPVGKVDNTIFTHEGAEITYMVSYFDLPQDGLLTLDKAAASYAAGRMGSIASQKNATLGQISGREIVVRLPDNQLSRVRLFAVGARWYQLIVDGPAERVNGAQTTSFLDSFKLNR